MTKIFDRMGNLLASLKGGKAMSMDGGAPSNAMTQVLEQAVDAVVSIDEENRVTFFNASAESLWGYSAAQVIGQNVRMLVPSQFKSDHDHFVNENRRTGIDKIVGTSRDVQLERVDGKFVWANLSLSRVRIGDGIQYTAFVKDISAQRRAQEIVSQTLEQALDAVVTIDQQNCVTFFNRSAEKLWGYDRSEVLGQNVKMLVPSEIRATHDNLVNANRTTGHDKIVGTSREVEVQRRSGDRIWANLSLSKVQLEGETIYTAFVKDITAQKRAQEIISQTLEQALDAVVTIDERNEVTFFNGAAETLWGYDRAEVVGKNVRMLVPKELQADHDSFVNANRQSGIDKIVGTSREVPVFRKDGSQAWGRLSLSKIDLGDIVTYTAFLADVTKEVENRARVQTLSLVADETGNSVIITDNRGVIEYVNPGFTRMTGYSFEEAIGRKPGQLLQGELTDQSTVEKIRASLDSRDPFYAEILNYTKQGESYWISLSINPIFGEDGTLERFISIQANVTDTKLRALDFTSRLDAIGRSNIVIEWSQNRRFVSANRVGQELLAEIDRPEPPLGDLMTDEEVAEVVSGGFVTRTFTIEHPDKKPVSISGSITGIIDYEGNLSRIVIYGNDVSDRLRIVQASSDTMRQVLDRINGMASSIGDIAKMTKLLSLNATIEAASAGDAGQGFAVVASEVGSLASKTSDSAREIAELADETRTRIREFDEQIRP